MIRVVALLVAIPLAIAATNASGPAPVRGLANAPEVAGAYDAILDADFLDSARLEEICGTTSQEVCLLVEALSLWWQIVLDTDSQANDQQFAHVVERAIAASADWTEREPHRAEAWFYLGAAYGTRSQWHVLRQERLAAARDGKQIKATLERALALDPDLHDANFGVGLYRYYADVAPATLRMLRWLLFLPGGDRRGGLLQLTDARERGHLVRGEADYQLHFIYLRYEKRFRDALALVQGLQARYPHNPLFHHIEAEIHDVYFHDAVASYTASARLLELATARAVHEPELASVRARLNMASQLDRLGDRARAIDLLSALVAEQPARPHGAASRARQRLYDLRTKN